MTGREEARAGSDAVPVRAPMTALAAARIEWAGL